MNGKLRSKMAVALDTDDAGLEKEALADEAVRRNIEGKQVVRVIIVKNKLVNIVVR